MPGSFDWFMKAKDITTCKQWALMFGFVSVLMLLFPNHKPFFDFVSPWTPSENRIGGCVWLIGSLILWYMPRDTGDDKK